MIPRHRAPAAHRPENCPGHRGSQRGTANAHVPRESDTAGPGSGVAVRQIGQQLATLSKAPRWSVIVSYPRGPGETVGRFNRRRLHRGSTKNQSIRSRQFGDSRYMPRAVTVSHNSSQTDTHRCRSQVDLDARQSVTLCTYANSTSSRRDAHACVAGSRGSGQNLVGHRMIAVATT